MYQNPRCRVAGALSFFFFSARPGGEVRAWRRRGRRSVPADRQPQPGAISEVPRFRALRHDAKRRLSTPGFLIYDFLTDRKSSIWGVLAAPGGRETLQKGWGRSPPPFWKVSRPPGAAQTPKIDDFRSVKKSFSLIKHDHLGRSNATSHAAGRVENTSSFKRTPGSF